MQLPLKVINMLNDLSIEQYTKVHQKLAIQLKIKMNYYQIGQQKD